LTVTHSSVLVPQAFIF